MKRGALQISFGWLFAIIVGGFIIFLAIFAVTKLMKTEQTAIDAETSKELDVLLNPLETSFESAKTTSFTMPVESRIYNKCTTSGNFGKQLIQISQKSFNKWTETDIDVNFANKYIFSEGIIEGKKFYIFSKPFNFPFKVADLIYITPSEKIYCFADEMPEEISEELENLNQGNILIGECSDGMIRICFEGDCDINVYSDHVEKDNEDLYFGDNIALMYAAIFGDKEIYECQLGRLMKKTKELSLIYLGKSIFVAGKGCETDINSYLAELNKFASDFKNFEEILSFAEIVEELEEKNYALGVCGLW